MSQKLSMYFPNYQLRRGSDPVGSREISFRHVGINFTMKMPFFGVTATQKAALRWAACTTPPVICVKHETPIAADKREFRDPDEPHRTYYPYAMAVATLECLGEQVLRRIKIYFCNVELHEENQLQHKHSRDKGVYVVAL